MLKKTLLILFASFMFSAFAATELLPKALIPLASPAGNQIFLRSYKENYFWPLSLQFVSEENLTYCGIASSVMVLNALNIPAPLYNTHGPYHLFTQDNFFTPNVEKILSDSQVKKHGISLDQLAKVLATFPVQVTTIHADKINADQFREIARKAIHNNQYIIVNFARAGLGEQGYGHLSPLAAYDAQSDRFLMLDVARYRYPSVWVKTQNLWAAMHSVDKDARAYRVFLIVSKQ